MGIVTFAIWFIVLTPEATPHNLAYMKTNFNDQGGNTENPLVWF